MTLIDFNKKELHDIYSSLQYTRLEIGFESKSEEELYDRLTKFCLLYTSPSPRDRQKSRMPSSA